MRTEERQVTIRTYIGNCPRCNEEQRSEYPEKVDILCSKCKQISELEKAIPELNTALKELDLTLTEIDIDESKDAKLIVTYRSDITLTGQSGLKYIIYGYPEMEEIRIKCYRQ